MRVKRRASGRCWGSGSLRWLRRDLGLQLRLEQLQSRICGCGCGCCQRGARTPGWRTFRATGPYASKSADAAAARGDELWLLVGA